MKLYATVSSERASKGQGGNEYIHVELRDEYRPVYFIEYTPLGIKVSGDAGVLYECETKGEKQKGELEHDLEEVAELIEKLDRDPEWRGQ